MVAAELAAIAPQVVRRLVLVDSFGLWLDDLPAPDPFGSARQVLAAKWHDPDSRPQPEPTIFEPDPDDPDAGALFEAQNRATATKFMWPIAERGLRRRLQYVTAPTLVVHGGSDGLLPRPYAEELVSLISGARLHVIEAAGHYPMIEQEDAFVEAVDGFLRGSHS
jgi:pimeloyl-ACP methyl ester carboxylesterase